MKFFQKNYVFFCALIGALTGYAILHPFLNLIHEFLHVHKEGALHFHWDEILVIIFDSFKLEYWLHAFSYAVLAGIAGYFFGKTVYAYKEMNKQMEKFSKIGINASSIIHDLNNPLTGIKWSAEMLKRTTQSKEQTQICSMIEQGVERIAKMITDIKLIAQGTDRVEIVKTPVDLKLFIEKIISKMILHVDISLKVEISGKVFLDKDYFERVIWNIIKNADEALEKTKDGKIEIAIKEEDGFVRISISDNGSGVPKNILKDLFELGKTFNKKGGSGIGLFNCRKIVEAHKGKIWVTSEEGRGTTFYIKIPKN